MSKSITLTLTEGTKETYGVPKLEIHIEGIEQPVEMLELLRPAYKFAQGYLPNPHIHVTTKEYYDILASETELKTGS